ncbi:MAG TPA: hypothetical protein VF432_11170 [Thermoanaerobaculia bacterium]
MAENNISIRYENHSSDTVSDVLVFTKNTRADLDALPPTAWQVISRVGYNGYHQFVYTIDTKIAVAWDGGNTGVMPSDTSEGTVWSLTTVGNDYELQQSGLATLTNEIDVINDVHVDNGIAVTLLKDGKPIMTQPLVAYGEKAEFGLMPKIYVGLVSNIIEGETLKSAVMSKDFTMFDLTGLKSFTFGLFGDLKGGYFFRAISEET